jgi:hypothetical protein
MENKQPDEDRRFRSIERHIIEPNSAGTRIAAPEMKSKDYDAIATHR